jgi:hypothetical protein
MLGFFIYTFASTFATIMFVETGGSGYAGAAVCFFLFSVSDVIEMKDGRGN